MKHFLKDDQLFAFEDDGSQDSLITEDMVAQTDEQVAVLRAPTATQLWAAYQAQAQGALDKSDITVLRCVEHGQAVPSAWAIYRAELRTIISAGSGDPSAPLPTHPTYPPGT